MHRTNRSAGATRIAKKTASSIEHDEDDTLIVHRSGRGWCGHVQTFDVMYNDDSNSAVSPGRKSLRPTRTFAIFHLCRNAYFWHLLVPLTFFVLALLNTMDVLVVFGPSYSAADELASVRSVNKSVFANNRSEVVSHSSSSTTVAAPALHPRTRASGPFWSHAATSSILLLLALLAATILPRLVSPLLFSERGHRSDLRLPIDIVGYRVVVDSSFPAAAGSGGVSVEDRGESGSSRAQTPVIVDPSTPAVLAALPHATVKEHVPFRRVPLTPKAIGVFFMVLLHPFVHYFLLFSNSSLALFPDDVQHHLHSAWFSPMSVISSWFTFDFTRYLLPSADIGCIVGRTYFWLVAVALFVVLYLVVLGILWPAAQMQMMREGRQYKRTFMWSVVWSVGLVGFPMWHRELFSAFGCRAVEMKHSETTAFDNVTNISTVTTTSELAAVSLLCADARCFGRDSGGTHTAYAATAFVIFCITFPCVFIMHTQLRRLSIVPRLEHGEKMGPLPRIDGLHLYMLILSRFVISALSGAFGSVESIAIAAFVLDVLIVAFASRAPCFSNVHVLNLFWRRFYVPACAVSSTAYAVWASTVFATMRSSMLNNNNLTKSDSGSGARFVVVPDSIINLGAIIEITSFGVLLLLLLLAYIAHMRDHRLVNPPSVNSGGNASQNGKASEFLASIFHLPSGTAGESTEPLIGGGNYFEEDDSVEHGDRHVAEKNGGGGGGGRRRMDSPSPASPPEAMLVKKKNSISAPSAAAIGQAVESSVVAKSGNVGAIAANSFSPRSANDVDDAGDGNNDDDGNGVSKRNSAAEPSPTPHHSDASAAALPRYSLPVLQQRKNNNGNDDGNDNDEGEDDVEHLSRSASLRGRSLRMREITLKDEPARLFDDKASSSKRKGGGEEKDPNSGGDLTKVVSSLELTF